MTTQPPTNRRSLALVVSLATLLTASAAAFAQAPQSTTPPAAPPPPKSVLGASPAPQRVPTPGPATDQPYAPQAILSGGIVVPIYPAGSPMLKADRIKEAEVHRQHRQHPQSVDRTARGSTSPTPRISAASKWPRLL